MGLFICKYLNYLREEKNEIKKIEKENRTVEKENRKVEILSLKSTYENDCSIYKYHLFLLVIS